MAKKTRRRKIRGELTRRQRSRLEQERRLQRIIVWSAVAVGVIAAGVLGYGLLSEKVLKPLEPVATVGDVSITVREFQARVRYERALLRWQLTTLQAQQAQFDPADPSLEPLLQQLQMQARTLQNKLAPESAVVLGGEMLDNMIEEELVRQEATARRIVVTLEEVQREIERNFGYERDPPTPAPTRTPSPTPVTATVSVTGTPRPTVEPVPTPVPMSEEEYRQNYNVLVEQVLKPSGFGEEGFRRLTEAGLLRELLWQQIGQEVPTTADQVKVRYLVFDTEEAAQETVERLDAGEEFEALLEELEAAEEPANEGRELNWYPLGYLANWLGPELEKMAFDMPVGQHSEPTVGPDGRYYVIQVVGHEERELDAFVLTSRREEAYQSWLAEERERVEYGSWTDWVPTEP